MDYRETHPSIIDSLFAGKWDELLVMRNVGMEQTIVKCGKCKYESITYAPFMT